MPYVASIDVVGGEGGTPFAYNAAQSGAVLKKLDVWVGQTQIKCLKVQMTNNEEKTYGKPVGKSVSFTFEDGERFSSLTLQPNHAGDRLGAITFTTSKGRKFEAAMECGGLNTITPTVVDVGSGMCFGVKGRSENEIDAFGFMFIKVTK